MKRQAHSGKIVRGCFVSIVGRLGAEHARAGPAASRKRQKEEIVSDRDN